MTPLNADPHRRIILPLDVPTLDKGKRLIDELAAHIGLIKVGLESMTAGIARDLVAYAIQAGLESFWDGKWNDIPNTIIGAAEALPKSGIRQFNIHIMSGRPSLLEAVAHRGGAQVLGVTILTSLTYDTIVELGLAKELNIANEAEMKQVKKDHMERLVARKLAWLAQDTGCHGVICSPQEIRPVREYCQPEFRIVTPSVRPPWADVNDQKRVMTPEEAIAAGADEVVIGRPISNPPAGMTRVDAAKRVAEEIARGLAVRAA